MKQKYPASDKFLTWTQSLSGMLTKMKTDHGSISEMVESAEWDSSKTDLALKMLRSLRINLDKMQKELEAHVTGKFG